MKRLSLILGLCAALYASGNAWHPPRMRSLNGKTETLTAISQKQQEPDQFRRAVENATSLPANALRSTVVRFANRDWLVVQSMDDGTCSPTGNCEFWLFEMGERPKLRLGTGMVQTFALADGPHPQLVLGSHGSATETSFRQYAFENDRFAMAGCYDVLCRDEDAGRATEQVKRAPCIAVRTHQSGGRNK